MSEYYHWDFLQLVEHLGYSEAVSKVEYYMKLSKQYASCKTFVVHSCNLLKTYQEPNPNPVTKQTKISDLTDSGLWDYANHRGLNEKWYQSQIKQRNARRAKLHG
jgi:hypothetical protein